MPSKDLVENMKEDIMAGDLHIHVCVLGYVQTNCYILSHKRTKEAIVIDPADQGNVIIDYIHREDLKVKAILLTHGHFDHILAAKEVSKELNVKIYANKKEKELLNDSSMNYSKMAGCDYTLQLEDMLEDGQIIHMAGFTIKVIYTPGHTIGGTCYYFDNEKVLFSGDTLFHETIGRTDLPTGDSKSLISSIKEKLMVLENEVLVYPGHGDSTSIGYEREFNEYLYVDGLK